MIDYAAQLADRRLFNELKKSAGRDGLTETDVAQLVGTFNHAASVAGPLLAPIPQTFRQYTDHDFGMFVKDEERAEVKRAFLGTQDFGAFTAGHAIHRLLPAPRGHHGLRPLAHAGRRLPRQRRRHVAATGQHRPLGRPPISTNCPKRSSICPTPCTLSTRLTATPFITRSFA